MSAPAAALKPELTISEKDRSRLVVYATRILRNHEDAEDAVQDAVMNAWSRGQYRGESKPLTYLYRCVRNKCGELMRNRRTMVSCPGTINFSYSPNIEASIDAHRKLETCLRVLPPKFSAVARGLASGMESGEIARYAGINTGAVKTRVFRLRLFLRLSKAVSRR